MNNLLRIMLLILLTATAATALSGCFDSSRAERDEPTVSSLPTSDQATPQLPAKSTKDFANPDSEEPAFSEKYGQLSDADLARTSWETPFRPRLWSCDGWRINEDSMTSESETPQPATFLRPYRNVVIECRFSRATENETKLATEENGPIACEIRLLSIDSNRWTSLSLSPASITLTESVDGANATVRTLRETDRKTGDFSEVVVRLTLTPNRLLVAVDGQMKINVTRPGSIMMTNCLAQFVVPKADIELSNLRFEGD